MNSPASAPDPGRRDFTTDVDNERLAAATSESRTLQQELRQMTAELRERVDRYRAAVREFASKG